MNAFKTLVTAAVLVAILYAGYVVINRYNQPGEGPPGVSMGWNAQLNINPGTSGGTAPPFTPPAPDASMAPPFTPSTATTTAPAAPTSQTPLPQTPLSQNPLVSDGPPPWTPTSDGARASEPVVPASASIGLDASSTESPRVLSPPPPSTMGGLDTPVVTPPGTTEDIETFLRQIDDQLRGGRLADAHLALSRRYFASDPTAPQTRQMEPLLDQLAGTVIFSREHLLEPAHRVTANETLRVIADACNVPVGLLAKINGLGPDSPLVPGQELKVIRGPFHVVVDLARYELTLVTADGRYAGRFAIGVGPDLAGKTGDFMVSDKTDTSALGTAVNTVYGSRWIGLGDRLGLHGTSNPQELGRPMNQGCISLGQRDVEDLYDILSIGSRAVIRR